MRLDVMRFPKREIKNDWTRFSDTFSISLTASLPTLSHVVASNYPRCFKRIKEVKKHLVLIYRHCKICHHKSSQSASFFWIKFHTIILENRNYPINISTGRKAEKSFYQSWKTTFLLFRFVGGRKWRKIT